MFFFKANRLFMYCKTDFFLKQVKSIKKKKQQMCQLWHFLSDDNDEIQPVKGLKWMSCLICALHFSFFPPNCLILPHLSHITPLPYFFRFYKLCLLFFPILNVIQPFLFNYSLHFFASSSLFNFLICVLLSILLIKWILDMLRKNRTVNLNNIECK